MLSEVFQLFSNKLFKMGDCLIARGYNGMGMGDKEEINIIRGRVLAQNTNNKQLLSRQTAHCKRKDRDCIVSLF